jgi:uncharacterized protein (DUF1697 family)
MRTHIVLLRGVNVGAAKRLAMADFRMLLTDLGHGDVATLLNSGNAVFSVAPVVTPAATQPQALAQAIERALAERLQLAVPVVVLPVATLRAAVAENPFTDPSLDASRLLLAFAADGAGLAALAPLAARAQPPDQFHLGAHAAYAYCPGGLLDSPVGGALLGKSARSVTTRNVTTAAKLLALAEA